MDNAWFYYVIWGVALLVSGMVGGMLWLSYVLIEEAFRGMGEDHG